MQQTTCADAHIGVLSADGCCASTDSVAGERGRSLEVEKTWLGTTAQRVSPKTSLQFGATAGCMHQPWFLAAACAHLAVDDMAGAAHANGLSPWSLYANALTVCTWTHDFSQEMQVSWAKESTCRELQKPVCATRLTRWDVQDTKSCSDSSDMLSKLFACSSCLC